MGTLLEHFENVPWEHWNTFRALNPNMFHGNTFRALNPSMFHGNTFRALNPNVLRTFHGNTFRALNPNVLRMFHGNILRTPNTTDNRHMKCSKMVLKIKCFKMVLKGGNIDRMFLQHHRNVLTYNIIEMF